MVSSIILRAAFTIAFVLSVAFSAHQSAPLLTCATTPTGLVSFWPGDNTANDFQSTNHGTLGGNATFATGMVGRSFSFDGASDVAIPSINAGSAFTLEMWLIDTSLMEAASDDWVVDFKQDGLAEIAIGRLPVRTPDEAERMIARIIGYNQSRASEETLLVADRNDGYSFEGVNDALRWLVNGDGRVVDIRRGQMSDAEAKAKLIDAINRGPKLVNYAGHGSVDLWSGGLLTSADAGLLKNKDHLSLFVLMNCLNGYFNDPLLDSLAEAIMKAPEGGAVAVWASSAMTMPEGQALINQELYRQLFRDRGIALGDAIRNAKASITDSDVRRSWILLGDPTIKLR